MFAPGPRPDGFFITADELRLHTIFQHDPKLLRLEIRGEQYDVTLTEPLDERALGAFVMFDDITPDRQTALSRFWSAIKGKRVPHDPRITPQRQQRARLMLRVVDARAEGATHRQIAEAIFPNHEHDPAKWVESPFRVAMNRLARDGMAFVRGGYRKLLRRPRRSR